MLSKIFRRSDEKYQTPPTPAWLTDLEPFPERQQEASQPRGIESQISNLKKTVQTFTHSSNTEKLKDYQPFPGGKFKHVVPADSSAKDYWLRETSTRFVDLQEEHKRLFRPYEDVLGTLFFSEKVTAILSEDGRTWEAESANVKYYLVLKEGLWEDEKEYVWENVHGVIDRTEDDFDGQRIPIEKT
ncbi:hypothetical protein GLAREA_06824 [Glarea lozoyensis ATCC 20868]|uniref:Uncharacterized protein n=1 Tax=Glarea lozoyensis (strain ATCC 20868 / MF5171) TaxID=1116229 RepID=S3DP13_GLAL2|nr:uncharacterized protein GLAREA_06824 [Glarea lozoyensis ATCC 20868]EPE33811.1 hypothetical protein GLAREA_06824 [Glarea lozoyensis ATCC 20868]